MIGNEEVSRIRFTLHRCASPATEDRSGLSPAAAGIDDRFPKGLDS